VWTGKPIGVWEEAEERTESLLEMVPIPGGSFLMGSPENEPGRYPDERLHEVSISPFQISSTTITRAQYAEVMERAPGSGGAQHPVTEVSWFDAITFCNHLSALEALPPCYRIRGQRVRWMRDGGGYRLPTEAEWEYAARAGTQTAWASGDDVERLEEYAWFNENSTAVQPVATRKANPWKLYDMHGNVWEWAWDVYGTYPGKAVRDPREPQWFSLLVEWLRHPKEGLSSGVRVLRGGAFWVGSWYVRSANRVRLRPRRRSEDVGFRCVRRPRLQP